MRSPPSRRPWPCARWACGSHRERAEYGGIAGGDIVRVSPPSPVPRTVEGHAEIVRELAHGRSSRSTPLAAGCQRVWMPEIERGPRLHRRPYPTSTDCMGCR